MHHKAHRHKTAGMGAPVTIAKKEEEEEKRRIKNKSNTFLDDRDINKKG